MLPLFLLEIIDTEDDRNKMELLYIKYQRLMFKVAKDILEDDYLAEDAVNDAFVKVVGYLDRIHSCYGNNSVLYYNNFI